MKATFSPSRTKGFTLIELIIVIAILATLASIAYPTYMSIQENAARTAAKKSCTDIVTGVERFKQDNNGMLPYDPNEATPDSRDQIYLETVEGKDAKLIKVLTNREEDDDSRLNASRDTYLRSDEQEQPMGGLFIDSAEGVNFYDPWGQPFYIVLCEEEQGAIDPFTSKRLRGKNCLVYSTGPDQDGKAAGSASADDSSAPSSKRARRAAREAAAAAAELAEEALEDNVYSWKNPK